MGKSGRAPPARSRGRGRGRGNIEAKGRASSFDGTEDKLYETLL